MNKKILSILIILSLLLVSLTSISANQTNTDENVADMTQPEEDTIIEEKQTQENTTTENNTEKIGEYADVVVPTNIEELQKFNILMNFVTPEGLNYFADNLEKIDANTYKDVITALRQNDREHLLGTVGMLPQDKIDTFFDEFLKIFDTTTTSTTTQEKTSNNPTSTITNTISQILGTNDNNNVKTNNYLNINPAKNNMPSQNNPMFQYNGQYYSVIDFVNLISDLYKKGDINSTEFLQILEDNGIDTSSITVDDGVINWGYLSIIPENPDDNTSSDDLNETVENTTNNQTGQDTQTTSSVESNSTE